MTFQVAIIGSPGSGKTVLTAVLSRYLSGYSDTVYMNPRGAYRYVGNNTEATSTSSYIHEMLDLLHRGQWASTGTAANTKYELGFELHIGGNAYEMKLLDSAGEDLQRIGTTYNQNELSPFQQRLFDYILSSNVVVIIVNLDHFTDASTLIERAENEEVLNEVLTNLVQAGTCHYILVCFTAYDKYKAIIDQTYGGNIINYLREELSMFFRSCQVAGAKVVHDYTEHGYGQKKILLDCIALAPVIAQQPAPGIPPDRVGKPPIRFDIRNPRHSWGISQIADWLCKCEQWERHWDKVRKEIDDGKETHDFLLYGIAPIVIGAIVGVLSWLVLGGIAGHTIATATKFFNSLFWGMPIGAAIGFLVGDKLKVLVTKKDGFLFKKDRGEKDEQQEEPTTSRPTGTSGTSTASSRSSGTGGTSTPPPRSSGTSGTSTPPPRPSGTSGTAASSGSETFD